MKAKLKNNEFEYVIWNDNCSEMKHFCGDCCTITYETCSIDDYYNLVLHDATNRDVLVPLHDVVIKLGDSNFMVFDRNLFEELFER